MMRQFPCPYLVGEVELTEVRERHISARHPDLLLEHWQRLAETLTAPDLVRTSDRFGSARLFSRWYTDLRRGKYVVVVFVYVVVVVVSEREPQERHWIITACIARKLAQGETEWERD